jgi:hypothetical protein
MSAERKDPGLSPIRESAGLTKDDMRDPARAVAAAMRTRSTDSMFSRQWVGGA